MLKSRLWLLTCLSAVLYCTPQQQKQVDFNTLDPQAKRLAENAVYGLEAAEGLEVTLFASEPMLINPTNLQVDERGRVWVCEALNYRNSHNPENPVRNEGDRILILEDTNEDGKADKSTVFYQGHDVDAALGIWAAGNRAVISCSPYVFVMTDSNDDGKCDQKDTLFTGVGGLQTDHAIHAFTFGPDGKFYFNYGNTGGQLMDRHGKPVLDQTGQPINDKGRPYRQGMIFRCNPDGSGVEVLAHNFRNNYEVAVDAFGGMWQSDNDDDGNKGVRINYIVDYGNYGYTDEMTGAGWQLRRIGWEPDIPSRHWHQNDPGVVPNLLQTGSGSPCGILVYEGDLLPPVFHNQMIHCEAGHNVVRAYPVKMAGAGYTGEVVNLLKGKDDWFRPSDASVAPDGSVFVADWYDPAVGGHKFGDPEHGRIYRVAPKRHHYRVKPADLSTAEAAVTALGSPNLSVKALAWEKLRAAADAQPALEKTWKEAKNPRLRARVLWLLGKKSEHPDTWLQAALQDPDADIRATALRLSRQGDPARMMSLVQHALKDSAPAVRREAALCLRYVDTPESAAAWAALATQYDGRDRWYLEALGIGSDLHADACFAAWQSQTPDAANTPAGREIVWRSRAKAALPLLSRYITAADATPAQLQHYFRAFDFHTSPEKNAMIGSLIGLNHPLRDSIDQYALFQIDPVFAKNTPAVRQAASKVLSAQAKNADYLFLTRRLDAKDQIPVLMTMALQHESADIRAGAAGLLITFGAYPTLVKKIEAAPEADKIKWFDALHGIEKKEWFAFCQRYLNNEKNSPALRRAALDALGSSWQGEIALLQLVETQKIPQAYRNTVLVRLSGVWNTEVRQKARAMLGMEQGKDAKPLPPVALLESRTGNPASGKAIFQQYCSICHQVNGEGVNFGPALSEIGGKLSKSALYTSILYPSSGINFGYEGFVLTLKDGNTAVGIVESKTATELVLRLNGGTKKNYNMSEVAKLEEMSNSLMPEGLHRAMSEQELVDLVEFLSSLEGNGDN